MISPIPKTAITCRSLGDGWRLNFLYPNLATLTRPDGSRHCAYVGFDKLSLAQTYLKLLSQNYQTELRLGKRLEKPWEIKVWDMTTEAIFALLRHLAANKP